MLTNAKNISMSHQTYCDQSLGEIAPNALQSQMPSTFPPASELRNTQWQLMYTCSVIRSWLQSISLMCTQSYNATYVLKKWRIPVIFHGIDNINIS